MAQKWIDIVSLRNIKIFYRLLIMFIFASLLPIMIYGILSYNKSSEVITEGISQSLESMLIQIGSTIGEKIEKVRSDSIEISYMDEIQDILMNCDAYTDRMKNATKEIITERMSTKFVFDNIVSEITLYTLDGDAVNVYGTDAFRLNLAPEHLRRFLEECREANGRVILKAMNENYEQRIASGVKLKRESIVLGKAIRKKTDGNIIGYMQMTFEEEKIRNIYRELSENLSADMFILDRDNIVISSVNESVRVGEPFTDTEILDRLGEDRYLLRSADGAKMVYNKPIGNSWVLVSVIPFAYLHADSEPVLQHFILIGMIGIAFGILITAMVSYSIISPIKRTIVGIRQFESGKLDTRLKTDGNDEVTILARQFNRMAREIGSLLDNIRQAERQKRRLEIQALQAQINPQELKKSFAKHSPSERAMKYVEERYREKITLRQVADALYVSPSYLSRMFKKSTGLNLVTYMNRVKMKHAREFILQRKMSLQEIAYEVGIANYNYFYILFKETYGISPSDFLKQIEAEDATSCWAAKKCSCRSTT